MKRSNDEILKELLSKGFSVDQAGGRYTLEWAFRSDWTVGDAIGVELEDDLVQFMIDNGIVDYV